MLVIDIREKQLCAALGTLGVPYKTANLDVGDIMIQNADGEPLLVAERKSHADFAASNADGRYREQRARLMAVRGSGVAVIYILEGTWADEGRMYGRTSEAQLKRLTTRLMLRYGLPVLGAASIQDTAQWCRTLVAQLADDDTVFQPDSEDATVTAMSGFTAALSAVKKANRTPLSTATGMLGAVPGLGPKRVTALLATHSIADLVALTEAELADLVVGKRLGAIAATLYEALRAHGPE
uniref:ERCC4 domain-containing protein n=1 Tax=viral metagenome TaxID=1070528 RepID=A0A6C0E5F5_9ZZZZ